MIQHPQQNKLYNKRNRVITAKKNSEANITNNLAQKEMQQLLLLQQLVVNRRGPRTVLSKKIIRLTTENVLFRKHIYT